MIHESGVAEYAKIVDDGYFQEILECQVGVARFVYI